MHLLHISVSATLGPRTRPPGGTQAEDSETANGKKWLVGGGMCYCQPTVVVLYSVDSDSFEMRGRRPVLARSVGASQAEALGA